MQKKIQLIHSGQRTSVGDGFEIRRAMPTRRYPDISPFLLLDHVGPMQVRASETPRGVDEHPHRGFETVTIVYEGALEHRDSSGNYGKIGPGDVQWMTAAAGLVHEEKHEQEFSRRGGRLEMIQLWVNLPAKDKMSPPQYQEIIADRIPEIPVSEKGGKIRVIAGAYGEVAGAARTFTPLHLVDLQLKAGEQVDIPLKDGHNSMLYTLSGQVRINDEQDAQEAQMTFFHRRGEAIHVQALADSKLLLLSGEPIDEPVVSYGPFVMNSQEEIAQAIADYRSGKMGRL